jgi:hypothetical protein
MREAILAEIAAVPAERRRGRHEPRVVKRKMSKFPTKARTAPNPGPRRIFRYEDHIRMVPAPRPADADKAAGRRSRPATAAKAFKTRGQEFWRKHLRSWRTSGLPRKAYCQQHNLETRSFNAWTARLRHEFRRPQPRASIFL